MYAIGGSSTPDRADALKTVERARVLGGDTAPRNLEATTSGAGSMDSGVWTYRVSAVLEDDGEALPTAIEVARLDSTGGVDISWNAPEGEKVTGYRIYRNDAADKGVNREHLIATAEANITSYSDEGASPATFEFPSSLVTPSVTDGGGTLEDGVWDYVVTMVTVNGESSYSTPEVEVDANNTGDDDNAVTLDWTAQEGALYYNVYRSPEVDDNSGDRVLLKEKIIGTTFTDDGSISPVVKPGPADLSVNATSLANGDLDEGEWTYGVSAVTERGESLPSASTITVSSSENAVTLSWKEVNDAISYRIYRSDVADNAASTVHMIKDNVTATEFTDRGLDAGTETTADGALQPPPGYLNYLPRGSLGKWMDLPQTMNVTRINHGAADATTTEGKVYIYVNGGKRDDGTILSSSEVARVGIDGALTDWNYTTDMAVARTFQGFTKATKKANDVLNLPYVTYFYSVCGINGTGTIEDSVEAAALISPPSSVGIQEETGAGLSTGTHYYRISAVVPDIGGASTVESLPAAEQSITLSGPSDIKLTWKDMDEASAYRVYYSTTSGNEQLLDKADPASACSPGICSYVDNGSASTVALTPVADGQLTEWSNQGNAPNNLQRQGHTSITGNGYLYVIDGGNLAGTPSEKSGGSELLSYGALPGTWTVPVNMNSNDARIYHSHAQAHSYVYIIGGNDGSNPLKTVEQVPF